MLYGPNPSRRASVCLLVGLVALAGAAAAQPTANSPAATPAGPAPTATAPAAPAPTASPTRPTYQLDGSGQLVPVAGASPQPGTDAAIIAEARRLLAKDQPRQAWSVLEDWIERNERSGSPLLPEAYLARGDAISASGNEFEALYDYETVIKFFPGSSQYVRALEREMEIAVRYAYGLDRKFLGVRFLGAKDVGEELLVRVQERLPGSRLAERAGIELAQFYYREHDLRYADLAYELFLRNYPTSSYRKEAMTQRVFANLGRFKGPRYDATPLLDARVLADRLASQYPDEAPLVAAVSVRVVDSLADQLLEAAQWYMRRSDPVSARATVARLLKLYPGSGAARAAREMASTNGWKLPEPTAPGAPTAPPSSAPPAVTPPAAVPGAPAAPGAQP